MPDDDEPEHFRAPSYRACEGCGADCCHRSQSTAEQPCWGEVIREEMGDEEIHYCKGHEWIWINPPYYKDYLAEGEEWPLTPKT
jgi:hypothetical protein